MNAVLVRIGDIFGGGWALIKRNPVRAQAAIVALIGLSTAFGLGWTAQQVAAVSAFSAGVLAFLTETSVTPLEKPVLAAGSVVTVVTPADEPNRTVTLR